MPRTLGWKKLRSRMCTNFTPGRREKTGREDTGVHRQTLREGGASLQMANITQDTHGRREGHGRVTRCTVELVESYLASSFCILLHTTSIESSCVSDPQTCLEQSRGRLRNVPINLFTSRSQHKIFGQIPTIIPESSSCFQDFHTRRISGTGSAISSTALN